MNFKTITILLSFGVVCSSAVCGMEPSFEEQMRSLQASSQANKELFAQHTKLISQLSEKNEAEFEELSTKINALLPAVQNGTISRQDAQREREALLQSHKNQVQTRLEETKQSIQRK